MQWTGLRCRGFFVQVCEAGKGLKGVQVAEEVPEHLQSTAKVPFSKVQNPQKCPVELCDEVATRPGVCPDFARMKLRETPTLLPWPRKGKSRQKENK